MAWMLLPDSADVAEKEAQNDRNRACDIISRYDPARSRQADRQTWTSAMAIAALSASRSVKVNVTEEASFWLGVCNEIRAMRGREALTEARAAAIH